MAILLRTEMIKVLIARRFGTVDDLVVEWAERVKTGQQRVGTATVRLIAPRYVNPFIKRLKSTQRTRKRSFKRRYA